MIPPQRVVLGFSFGRSVEPRLCPLRTAGVGSSDSIAVARLPVGALRGLEINCGTTQGGVFNQDWHAAHAGERYIPSILLLSQQLSIFESLCKIRSFKHMTAAREIRSLVMTAKVGSQLDQLKALRGRLARCHRGREVPSARNSRIGKAFARCHARDSEVRMTIVLNALAAFVAGAGLGSLLVAVVATATGELEWDRQDDSTGALGRD
jgi:hypothetical protein